MWSMWQRLLKGAREGDPVLVREAWWTLSFGRLSSQYGSRLIPYQTDLHLIHWYTDTWWHRASFISFIGSCLFKLSYSTYRYTHPVSFRERLKFLSKRKALDAGASTETRCMVLHLFPGRCVNPKRTLHDGVGELSNSPNASKMRSLGPLVQALTWLRRALVEFWDRSVASSVVKKGLGQKHQPKTSVLFVVSYNMFWLLYVRERSHVSAGNS